MVEGLINTFEELKKYVFIINRKDKGIIYIRFQNDSFYHLVRLHKIKNFDKYFPTHIKSKDKRYKYIKKHTEKFNNILENQLKEKDTLKLRITTFNNVLNLLKGFNTSLYSLKFKNNHSSLYEGDYGLMKIYEKDICCLLGLKTENKEGNKIFCVPNSWMASRRINQLVELRRPMYMENISMIPINIDNEDWRGNKLSNNRW